MELKNLKENTYLHLLKDMVKTDKEKIQLLSEEKNKKDNESKKHSSK